MGCNFSTNKNRADTAFRRGLHSAALQQYSEAECHFLLAWVLRQKEYGVTDTLTITAHRKVGDMCMLQSRYEDAEDTYHDIVRVLTTNEHDNRTELLAQMYVQLALAQYSLYILLKQRRCTLLQSKRKATQLLHQSENNLILCVSMLEARLGKSSILIAIPLMTLSEIYVTTGRADRALRLMQRVVGLQCLRLKTNHMDTEAVRHLMMTVKAQVNSTRYERAATVIQKTWRMVLVNRSNGLPSRGRRTNNLGAVGSSGTVGTGGPTSFGHGSSYVDAHLSQDSFASAEFAPVAESHDPLWKLWQKQFSCLFNPVIVNEEARMWTVPLPSTMEMEMADDAAFPPNRVPEESISA